MDTQVTIVGAGPVGLTAAMDLARRGIDVTVVESRTDDEPADAKCNTVASRTMEVFRQLGIADAVRAAGLADDFPTDVIFTTAVSGEELTRIVLPSRAERFGPDGRSAPGYIDSHWQTPEPVVRISQLYLNPILLEHARTFGRITIVPETTVLRYDDAADEVTVHCENRSGAARTITSRYLIGCDGGTSGIRKQMGVQLLGDAELSRSRSSLVRCPAIKDLFPGKPAWMSWVVNPRQTGTVVAIDGDELWLVHRTMGLNRSYESVDLDQSMRDVLGVDDSFQWEVVHHQDWTARRLVAGRFRSDNVFICGDAAHIWIPFAGYGMNAGIADCTNLTWMMAAVLNGEADQQLLAAHERERHPITEQVSQLAMGKALEYMDKAQNRRIPKVLESRNFIGRMVRRRLGRQLYDINWPQFGCEGLNFGYYYDDSPVICYDDSTAPGYDMGHAEPSTVPGCRLPHFWMPDGTSLYDRLGMAYTMLNFSGAPVDASFVDAFIGAGLPLDVLDVAERPVRYQHRFVLGRTDQHVVWRGDELPDDLETFTRRLVGQGTDNKTSGREEAA